MVVLEGLSKPVQSSGKYFFKIREGNFFIIIILNSFWTPLFLTNRYVSKWTRKYKDYAVFSPFFFVLELWIEASNS